MQTNIPLYDLIQSTPNYHTFQDLCEKAFIQSKLVENGNNKSACAKSISVQRSHLYSLIKKHKI